MMRRSEFTSALLLLIVACTPGASKQRITATIDTLPGNVIRVRNFAPTRWNDTNGWKLVLERTIHPAAESAGELMHPSAVVVNSTGDIFVMEQSPALIKHYSADGTFVGNIGRKGSGPGEFGEYGTLYVAHDTIVHQDARQSRVTTFTMHGRFISAWASSPNAEHGLFADSLGRIPIPVDLPGASGVARFRIDGTVTDSVLYPVAPPPKTWSATIGRSNMGMLIPFNSDRITQLDRAGRLIWGDQSDAHFVYSIRGRDTVRLVQLELAPVGIPESVRRATFADAEARNGWIKGRSSLADLPRDYPRWTAIIADGVNNLWILVPGPLGPGDHWQVLNPEGVWLGTVRAPFDHADGTFWTVDHVYVMITAPDGTPGIAVYRIQKDNH